MKRKKQPNYYGNLLSSNTKLAKAAELFGKDKVVVAGLSLAPDNRSGYNVCPASGW
jgi:hypothetical protein